MIELIFMWILPSVLGALIVTANLKALFRARHNVRNDNDLKHLRRYFVAIWLAFLADIAGIVSGIITFDSMVFDQEAWYWSMLQRPGMDLEGGINIYMITIRSCSLLGISIFLYWNWTRAEGVEFFPGWVYRFLPNKWKGNLKQMNSERLERDQLATTRYEREQKEK